MENMGTAFSGGLESDYFQMPNKIRERVYAINVEYESDSSEVVGPQELEEDVEKVLYDNSMEEIEPEEIVDQLLEKVGGEGVLNGGDVKKAVKNYYQEIT